MSIRANGALIGTASVAQLDELLALALTELPEALRGVLEEKGEPVPGNVPPILPPPPAPPKTPESQSVV